MRLLVMVLAFFMCSQALAVNSTEEFGITPEELEDLVVKGDDGLLKLNNFSITEKPAFMAQGLNNIKASFSARNKGEKSYHFSVMMTGLNKEGAIIWSLAMEPMMGTLTKANTEQVSSDAYAPPGLAAATKTVWIRITGNFKREILQ